MFTPDLGAISTEPSVQNDPLDRLLDPTAGPGIATGYA